MVSRVEQIMATDIDKIGDMEYIKYRNDMLGLSGQKIIYQ